MDKFTTSRRRPTWQSKAPAWPFILGAFILAVVISAVASPFSGGMILGDGTSNGSAMVWIKALSNIVIPALLIGVTLGMLLNSLILAPGGRHGAMKWTGLLVAACAVAAAPVSVARGIEADRLGYELRLRESLNRSRIAAQQAERDYARRMYLLLQHQGGFDLYALKKPGGDVQSRKVIDGQKDLLKAARRDYDKGQDEARAALAEAIVGEADREAVLLRFDTARVERKALMDKVFGLQERMITLREEELAMLIANRGQWRPTPGGASINNDSLLNRLRANNAARLAAADEHDRIYDEIRALDTRTEEGIDRVLYAAAKIER